MFRLHCKRERVQGSKYEGAACLRVNKRNWVANDALSRFLPIRDQHSTGPWFDMREEYQANDRRNCQPQFWCYRKNWVTNVLRPLFTYRHHNMKGYLTSWTIDLVPPCIKRLIRSNCQWCTTYSSPINNRSFVWEVSWDQCTVLSFISGTMEQTKLSYYDCTIIFLFRDSTTTFKVQCLFKYIQTNENQEKICTEAGAAVKVSWVRGVCLTLFQYHCLLDTTQSMMTLSHELCALRGKGRCNEMSTLHSVG